MKAHYLNDGESVLVTGTLDPDEAKVFLESNEPDMFAFAEEYSGRGERGNVIPQSDPDTTGYAWMWYANKNGRCRGVVFK